MESLNKRLLEREEYSDFSEKELKYIKKELMVAGLKPVPLLKINLTDENLDLEDFVKTLKIFKGINIVDYEEGSRNIKARFTSF